MQGLWKDKRKHFVKDKFIGYTNRRTREFNFIEYDRTNEHLDKANTTFYIKSIYGQVLGWDIPWRLFDMGSKFSRRPYEKIVQSAKRAILRDYFRKGDFEKEVPQLKNYEKTARWLYE